MCLDADFMTFLKTAWFWVWCQMHPIEQCPWDSLGFGVVMARTSSVKYWFLATPAKTYHLQVWAQSCPKNRPSLQFWKLLSLCWMQMLLDFDFLTFLKTSWFWGLVPDVTYRTMSLEQFGFCCGHGQNQFSQIVIFSSSFKNLSFAGLSPELSQTKAKLAILEIVQLMARATVAGCWFFDILKNSLILGSGARCVPQQKLIGTVLVLFWSWPEPV